MVNNKKLCVSVPEMGEMLGIGRNKAYELAKQYGFPSIRVDNRIIIPVQALQNWLSEQAEQVPQRQEREGIHGI
ncbi:DNA-binding protein [Butyricicoccus sp. 1XD8-22]|nr:DNA-binding protein [Butyricicoccus sp. 1XD8-22]